MSLDGTKTLILQSMFSEFVDSHGADGGPNEVKGNFVDWLRARANRDNEPFAKDALRLMKHPFDGLAANQYIDAKVIARTSIDEGDKAQVDSLAEQFRNSDAGRALAQQKKFPTNREVEDTFNNWLADAKNHSNSLAVEHADSILGTRAQSSGDPAAEFHNTGAAKASKHLLRQITMNTAYDRMQYADYPEQQQEIAQKYNKVGDLIAETTPDALKPVVPIDDAKKAAIDAMVAEFAASNKGKHLDSALLQKYMGEHKGKFTGAFKDGITAMTSLTATNDRDQAAQLNSYIGERLAEADAKNRADAVAPPAPRTAHTPPAPHPSSAQASMGEEGGIIGAIISLISSLFSGGGKTESRSHGGGHTPPPVIPKKHTTHSEPPKNHISNVADHPKVKEIKSASQANGGYKPHSPVEQFVEELKVPSPAAAPPKDAPDLFK